jgi:hypothetical protein
MLWVKTHDPWIGWWRRSLRHDVLEDIILEFMAGSSPVVVWQIALALRSASFGTSYLVIFAPGVSCWASLEVHWGAPRLLILGGGRLLVALRVQRWSDSMGAVAMAPLFGELRPVTDARLDNVWCLRNCNGRAGCGALPVIVFSRSCLVWRCGLFVFAMYNILYPGSPLRALLI